MFIIGATPAIIILLLRRHVSEPATFRRTKGGQVSAFSAIFSIFTRRYAARTALATLMCTGINGGFFAVMVWLPAYLKLVKGLSFVNTGAYLGVVICGSFTGYLFGSFLADAIGRKKTLALFALGALVTIFAYTRFELGHGYLVWIGFPLGLFTSGIFASIGSFLSELFPTTIRANAQGFSFNVGRGIGSVFPMLIGYASAKLSLGGAIGVFAATSYVLLFAALLILPETAGRELEES
jgi:fucose permease